MANDNTLNVEISASVDGLKKGLTQAEKGVKTFGTQTDKMTAKTTKMGKAVSSNAVPALTSFSQVIQDAPYGIQGVANNITQLTSQFGYLSKSSGGAMGALKGMIGVMAGPAGILLAVSALTSLMVSYDKEIKALFSTQDDLNDSFKEASEEIGKEISQLNKLTGALDNTNLSEEELVKLRDKIQKDYPKYLGNIDLEKASRDELKKSIDLEKTALVGLGIAKALEAKKAPLYAKLAEAQLKQNELDAMVFQTIATQGGGGVKTAASQRKFLQDNIDSNVQFLESELIKIGSSVDSIVKKYGVDLNEFLNLGDGEAGSDSITAKIDTFKGDIVTGLTGLNAELVPLTTSIQDTLLKTYPPADMMATQLALWKQHIEGLKVSLLEFKQAASDIIVNGIGNTFGLLGSSIGEALANGTNVLKAAGGALLSGLGSILVQLGEMAIAAGVANLALFAALSGPPNPASAAAAIAAGIALVAVGSVVSSLNQSVASGGTGTDYSSSSTGSSSNYGSSTSSSYGSTSGGTYVFEIAGTKLIGVLKNTLDRNKALGGQNLAF